MRYRNKKNAQPEEEGAPAWMNTYGDMITLLLTFFVLLFSFSTIDAQKWEELVSALSGTPFVDIVDSGDMPQESIEADNDVVATPAPTPIVCNNSETLERFDKLYEKIKNHIEENNLGYILNVEKQEDSILLRLSADSAFFDSGSDEIKDKTGLILKEICDIIVEYSDLIASIQFEGNADSVPVSSARFEDNWQLASSRARKVLLFVQNNMSIESSKLTVVSHGEYQPIASNDTDEGKALNRRVDIVIESILKD